MWNDGVYIFKELDRISESDLERVSMILPEYRLEKVKNINGILIVRIASSLISY